MTTLTRRGFLAATGGLGAAGLFGSVGARAWAGQPFDVGYQIFGWGRYFPSAWWRGAAAVGALGYRGIEGEYTIAELYEGREEEFVAGMRRCGVQLAALYSSTDLERPAHRYENRRKNLMAAAFCRRMGARMIVIGGTEATEKSPALIKEWGREANELGRQALDAHGVRLGVHPHVGSLIETRQDIDMAMDATDPRYFYLAPDTGHLVAGGSDPVEVFTTYARRIAHAHLKDYQQPAVPGARGTYVPLGRGAVDFPQLVQILRRSGFDGWLDVELDGGRGADPAAVAREARDYIRGTLALSLETGPRTSPRISTEKDQRER
ncbi:MAG: TIM barrel protein [Acidobacteria bacterium]|nr:TIM barrel protein [Acidobacteriota bacterium]